MTAERRRAPHCWFVGLTTLDVVHYTPEFPGSNQKVQARAQALAAGGPAANAAVTAAVTGSGATLISAVGQGATAELARADLERHGVRIVDAAVTHDLSVSSVIVSPGGDRAVVSMDAGSPCLHMPDLGSLPYPGAVLLDGHHPDLQRHALAWAHARGVPIVIDAGRWRPVYADLIACADVVACSADFALPGRQGQTREELASVIVDQGARAAVITGGGQPVVCFDGEEFFHLQVPAVSVRDTLGAGDVFHGALTAALARGASLREATESAIEIASRRVQREGLRDFLASMTSTSLE